MFPTEAEDFNEIMYCYILTIFDVNTSIRKDYYELLGKEIVKGNEIV
jgi:hypothetical protein